MLREFDAIKHLREYQQTLAFRVNAVNTDLARLYGRVSQLLEEADAYGGLSHAPIKLQEKIALGTRDIEIWETKKSEVDMQQAAVHLSNETVARYDIGQVDSHTAHTLLCNMVECDFIDAKSALILYMQKLLPETASDSSRLC